MTVAYFRKSNLYNDVETVVNNQAGEIRIVCYNEQKKGKSDTFGYMTIQGKDAKNPMAMKLVTYQNYRDMMAKLADESFASSEEMETLFEAFLEMAYDVVEELFYLTYESEIIEPERRLGLYQNLSKKLRESGRLAEYEIEAMADYEAEYKK